VTPEDEARAGVRWIPFPDALDVDDSCITVQPFGGEPKQYWAKADGRDPKTGCISYKLLPMERG
jgi:hypothetical protein